VGRTPLRNTIRALGQPELVLVIIVKIADGILYLSLRFLGWKGGAPYQTEFIAAIQGPAILLEFNIVSCDLWVETQIPKEEFGENVIAAEKGGIRGPAWKDCLVAIRQNFLNRPAPVPLNYCSIGAVDSYRVTVLL